jgi:hypothetical protein
MVEPNGVAAGKYKLDACVNDRVGEKIKGSARDRVGGDMAKGT